MSRIWTRKLAKAPAKHPEYVPGRDELIGPAELEAGLNVEDSEGNHLLFATALPDGALEALEPAVLRVLHLYLEGKLKPGTDGRQSAGPIDLQAFLQEPANQELLRKAVEVRRKRLARRKGGITELMAVSKQHCVHVSTTGRKVFIGEPGDVTKNGTCKFGFGKNYRSGPIPSWTGGAKASEGIGKRASCVLTGVLSDLLKPEEPSLTRAANLIWDEFANNAATREVAMHMLAQVDPKDQLGRTGWNAFSVNVDFRTGTHMDSKNVPGSYSALIMCETGESFCGGFYMLPCFRKALDLHQGAVLFHRSGDPDGVHGNAEMFFRTPNSHRIAVVFFQTKLDKAKGPAAESTAAGKPDGKPSASRTCTGNLPASQRRVVKALVCHELSAATATPSFPRMLNSRGRSHGKGIQNCGIKAVCPQPHAAPATFPHLQGRLAEASAAADAAAKAIAALAAELQAERAGQLVPVTALQEEEAEEGEGGGGGGGNYISCSHPGLVLCEEELVDTDAEDLAEDADAEIVSMRGQVPHARAAEASLGKRPASRGRSPGPKHAKKPREKGISPAKPAQTGRGKAKPGQKEGEEEEWEVKAITKRRPLPTTEYPAPAAGPSPSKATVAGVGRYASLAASGGRVSAPPRPAAGHAAPGRGATVAGVGRDASLAASGGGKGRNASLGVSGGGVCAKPSTQRAGGPGGAKASRREIEYEYLVHWVGNWAPTWEPRWCVTLHPGTRALVEACDRREARRERERERKKEREGQERDVDMDVPLSALSLHAPVDVHVDTES